MQHLWLTMETATQTRPYLLKFEIKDIYRLTPDDPTKTLHGKKSYTLEIGNSIDWDGVQAIGKTLSRAEQTWLTKHVIRFNLVGQQMN